MHCGIDGKAIPNAVQEWLRQLQVQAVWADASICGRQSASWWDIAAFLAS